MRTLTFDSIRISKNRKDFELTFYNGKQKVVKAYSSSEPLNLNEKTLRTCFFHIGLLNLIDFEQVFLPDKILINCGRLTKSMQDFYVYARDWYMRQFFFEEKMAPRFAEISSKGEPHKPARMSLDKGKAVASFGGGKESMLCFHLFRKWRIPVYWFYRDKAANAGIKKRLMDSLQLNEYMRVADRSHGEILFPKSRTHTGISVFMLLMAAIAMHKKIAYICMGNERSAVDPYAAWEGKIVNHQFDKTPEYRRRMGSYIKRHICPGLNLFSLFEGLYEYKLAKLIPICDTKKLMLMTSCNNSTDRKRWCKSCAKCAWGFAMLSFSLGKETAIKIVGRDLFEQPQLYYDMLNPNVSKPFECIGERPEIWLVMAKCIQKGQKGKALEFFRKEYLPKVKQRLKSYEEKYSKTYPNPALPAFIRKKSGW